MGVVRPLVLAQSKSSQSKQQPVWGNVALASFAPGEPVRSTPLVSFAHPLPAYGDDVKYAPHFDFEDRMV